jgi:SAM-dependent methyltransferase
MSDAQAFDVGQIMDRIRENIRRRRSAGEGVTSPNIEQDDIPVLQTDGEVAADLDAMDSCYDVYHIHFTSHRRVLGAFVIFVKKILRRLLTPMLERQVAYNAANARIVTCFKEHLEALAQRQGQLREQLRAAQDQTLRALREQIDGLGQQQAQLREELLAAQGQALHGVQQEVAALKQRQGQLREEVLAAQAQTLQAMGAQLQALMQQQSQLEGKLEAELHQQIKSIIRETLSSADSWTGPKATAGLWFNEPILTQYDDQARPSWSGTTERIVEKAWVLRYLSDIPIDAKLLDVGCSESLLSIELASNGFQVTGIDIRPYPLRHPNFKFLQADICNSNLESASYDVIIALSTIEHLGLGWYGDPQDDSSDHRAMREIYRLLKPGGRLLMTVPFGQRVQTPLHRIYDNQSLRALLHGFTIERIEYAVKVDDKTWISRIAEEKASQQKHDPASNAPSAVAIAVCVKP